MLLNPNDELILTPLGAAIAEAIPNQKLISKIKRSFKQGKCPISEIFNAKEIESFYRTRNQEIKAVTLTLGKIKNG